MKTFYIAAAAILVSSAALASQPWTLDSCISYALSHNIDVRARSLESRSAELDVTESFHKSAQVPTRPSTSAEV